MASITKVALAGATGNLGPSILKGLLDAGFQVTVLTRQSSTHSFPANVNVSKVDYESLDSLTSALQGQDAVVSTLASLALGTQLLLIDAAVKAGVKRFIPSEFGSNTINEKARQLPVYKDKLAVQAALQKEADAGRISYTLVLNGPFLDWGLKVGFVGNVPEKKFDLWDGGERVFSATSLPSVGKATANILKHPEETKNRAVYIQDTAITLKQLLAVCKKAAGEDGWTINDGSTEEMYNNAWAELKKEQPNHMVFVFGFLKTGVWGEGYGSHYEKTDNELLGLKDLSEAELEQLVANVARPGEAKTTDGAFY
ncbi:uncharacterized protein KY384_000293 [Bacidia gigantensis]|uniref:uncharacterized protein n=1 Tax=Bacidia gigantensis TaxID=2732470 RepID=UPI001D048514|nr:uncharacterized protein KY384_000293 [Bacidia gigantensis]KAG8526300.1 hypothetical protein KY384_000293 [Bacidia gigantensis]